MDHLFGCAGVEPSFVVQKGRGTLKHLHAEMLWLTRPPRDVQSRIAKLRNMSVGLGPEIRDVARSALGLIQLVQLADVITDALDKRKTLKPLLPLRIALISNSTIALTTPALIASAARYGIALEIIGPTPALVEQECLAPESLVNSSEADLVLFALDYHALQLKPGDNTPESADAIVNEAMRYLRGLREGIQANLGATCIWQTLVPPVERLFGGFDRMLPGTMSSLVASINFELVKWIKETGDHVFDVAGLAEIVGTAEWHTAKQWNTARVAFSDEFLPLYGDHLGRLLAAVRGKSRKALVLDLDNVVWGGVIGEDGLEGIRVSRGDGRSEAHLAIQRWALDLRDRGILLAVCSKNDEKLARKVFNEHPDMLLKLEHIAVFKANWDDKAQNLRAIADELSFSQEALVFVDDSPFERNLVRQLLPDIAVPELTNDPADFVQILSGAGYFEAAAISCEDFERSKHYQLATQRLLLRSSVFDVISYLKSLQMVISFAPFEALTRARTFQLFAKTNQYNLTGSRYTLAEIEAMERNEGIFTLQARLSDVFTDNGIICLVVCRVEGEATWFIDNWVMSCRVIGRHVEEAVFAEMLQCARSAGIQRLIGFFCPTGRNQLVADHYSRLGFSAMTAHGRAGDFWQLQVERRRLTKHFITTARHHPACIAPDEAE